MQNGLKKLLVDIENKFVYNICTQLIFGNRNAFLKLKFEATLLYHKVKKFPPVIRFKTAN